MKTESQRQENIIENYRVILPSNEWGPEHRNKSCSRQRHKRRGLQKDSHFRSRSSRVRREIRELFPGYPENMIERMCEIHNDMDVTSNAGKLHRHLQSFDGSFVVALLLADSRLDQVVQRMLSHLQGNENILC